MDLCALQRPLDDRTQPRVDREAAAVEDIVAAMDSGRLEILRSRFLVEEALAGLERNRRDVTLRLIERLGPLVDSATDDDGWYQSFRTAGITAYDAAHLTAAVLARADVFCSCDDRLVRRARTVAPVWLRILLPVELAEELTLA